MHGQGKPHRKPSFWVWNVGNEGARHEANRQRRDREEDGDGVEDAYVFQEWGRI